MGREIRVERKEFRVGIKNLFIPFLPGAETTGKKIDLLKVTRIEGKGTGCDLAPGFWVHPLS